VPASGSAAGKQGLRGATWWRSPEEARDGRHLPIIINGGPTTAIAELPRLRFQPRKGQAKMCWQTRVMSLSLFSPGRR